MTTGHRLVAPKDLGAAIRRLRTERGLTLSQAAERVGMSVSDVEQAEQSRHQGLVRVRRRIIERLTDHTLEGPFYRLRPGGGSS